MATDDLNQIVWAFLKQQGAQQGKGKTNVLLALSGGPDSLALLLILFALKEKWPFHFAIAHVDHGWRAASSMEAQLLSQRASELGIPFHLKVLEPSDAIDGNKEAVCRDLRRKFFQQLCFQYGYQAVLLGHHADDQAETVLKRLFEGASLSSLGAMRQVAEIDGLLLWRPFLTVRKAEILRYLQRQALVPFDDETNRDPRFMRARFRTQIFPSLAKEFGKDVSPCLQRLGSHAVELSDYLDERIAAPLASVVNGPFGALLDITKMPPLHRVELKHLIYRLCQNRKLSLATQELDLAVDLLLEGKADKELRSKNSLFQIDRGRFFILSPFLMLHKETLSLSTGLTHWNGWSVEVREIAPGHSRHAFTATSPSDWLSVWRGEMGVLLPKGTYRLAAPQPAACYPGNSSLSKWWGDAKVPAFFRNAVPLVWRCGTSELVSQQQPVLSANGLIEHEFLTGRRKQPLPVGEALLHLRLVKLPVEGE